MSNHKNDGCLGTVKPKVQVNCCPAQDLGSHGMDKGSFSSSEHNTDQLDEMSFQRRKRPSKLFRESAFHRSIVLAFSIPPRSAFLEQEVV